MLLTIWRSNKRLRCAAECTPTLKCTPSYRLLRKCHALASSPYCEKHAGINRTQQVWPGVHFTAWVRATEQHWSSHKHLGGGRTDLPWWLTPCLVPWSWLSLSSFTFWVTPGSWTTPMLWPTSTVRTITGALASRTSSPASISFLVHRPTTTSPFFWWPRPTPFGLIPSVPTTTSGLRLGLTTRLRTHHELFMATGPYVLPVA